VKQSLPLKIDLHTHTHYSKDATTTLKEVIQYAKKRGLDGVAVTDHDTISGALKLAKQKHLVVIPGIEISTVHGHVLALNIAQPIAPKLCLTETVEKIHQLGGIAVIAHPAAVLKTGLGHKISSASKIDAVEVINTAAFPFFLSTYLSRRLAKRLRLPQTAGSDAHHPHEIGKAYTIVNADSKRDDIIEAVKKGKAVPYGEPMSWAWRFQRIASGVQIELGGRYSSKFSI